MGKTLEHVIAIRRELMLHHQSAARAERQTFDVIILRRVGRHAIGRQRRLVHISHSDPADFGRRRGVAFQQRRRQRQCAGDVVESARRIVGRQILRRDRSPAPACRESRSRTRCDSSDAGPAAGNASTRCGPVRFSSHVDHRFIGRPGRPRHPRGRHHAGPQLAHHQLPLFRVVGDVRRCPACPAPDRRFSAFGYDK